MCCIGTILCPVDPHGGRTQSAAAVSTTPPTLLVLLVLSLFSPSGSMTPRVLAAPPPTPRSQGDAVPVTPRAKLARPATRPSEAEPFWFEYRGPNQPGPRLWERVDEQTWIERHAPNALVAFKVMGRERGAADGRSGTVVTRLPRNDMQVLLPDPGSGGQVAWRNGDGSGPWRDLGERREGLPPGPHPLGPHPLPASAALRVSRLAADARAAMNAGRHGDAAAAWRRVEEVRLETQPPDWWEVASARWEARTQERVGVLRESAAQQFAEMAVVLPKVEDRANPAGAEAAARRALALAQELFPGAHPMVANRMADLALLLSARHDHAAAEPLIREALRMHEQTYGAGHPHYAASLKILGTLLRDRGDYAAAEPLYREVVATLKRAVGEVHPDYATALGDLSGLLYQRGHYRAAELLMREVVEVVKRAVGPGHRDYATALNKLALLLWARGQYAHAEPLYREALAVTKAAVGEKHPDYPAALHNFAELLRSRGDYAAAEPLLREALEARERAVGDADPGYATSLLGLASIQLDRGDYAAAEPLTRQAVAIVKKVRGADHPDYATALSFLAKLLDAKGDHKTAEELLREVLSVTERSVGEAHPGYATALNNLAAQLAARGDHAEAESLLRKAVALAEQGFGDAHPHYATNLINLATRLRDRGDYEAAEPLMREAVGVYKRALGEAHPDYATSLNNLALLLLATDRGLAALRLLESAWRVRESTRASVFATGAEREQLAFAAVLARDSNMILSAAGRLSGEPTARRLALDAALSAKGAVFQAVAARGAAALAGDDPRLRGLFDAWEAAARRHRASTLAGPGAGPPDEYQRGLAELARQAEKAERALAAASAAFTATRVVPVRCAEVAAALPKASALVEFVRYQEFRFGERPGRWGEWQYAALVLVGGQPRGGQPHVSLLPLGTAVRVEESVAAWRRALRRHRGTRPDRLYKAGRALAAVVWDPVASELKANGCGRAYLSPDGALALVPFAALPGVAASDRFVLDDYEIAYVASGRDLLKSAVPTPKPGPPLLVGAPSYGPPPSAPSNEETDRVDQPEPAVAAVAAELRATTRGAFVPLAETGPEVRMVAELLRERQGGGPAPVVLTGTKATEAALKAARRPRLLHLATHGFFLADAGVERRGPGSGRPAGVAGPPDGDALLSLVRSRDPMQRSGVALAGANDAVCGRCALGGDEGILTAAEVAGMDLWGTELVVISACESGLGEHVGSEGLSGLRRAFALAGSRHLVMSLCQVDDRATRDLMVRFYRYAATETSPARSLIAAQREFVAATRRDGGYPHPYLWATFVASGTGTALEQPERAN